MICYYRCNIACVVRGKVEWLFEEAFGRKNQRVALVGAADYSDCTAA